MADKKVAEAAAPMFSKAQFMTSAKYAGKRDVISALLAKDKSYTAAQVDMLIERYLKGKVL